MSVNLETLAAEINTLAESVKTLKTAGATGDEVKAAVDGLLAAKQQYADNNGGLGTDGLTYVPPMTNAQKKAKAKADKAAAKAAAAEPTKAAGTAVCDVTIYILIPLLHFYHGSIG